MVRGRVRVCHRAHHIDPLVQQKGKYEGGYEGG